MTKKTEIPSEQQETKRATNSSSRKDLQERKTTEEMAVRYNVLWELPHSWQLGP
jgi:hypothetical protein